MERRLQLPHEREVGQSASATTWRRMMQSGGEPKLMHLLRHTCLCAAALWKNYPPLTVLLLEEGVAGSVDQGLYSAARVRSSG